MPSKQISQVTLSLFNQRMLELINYVAKENIVGIKSKAAALKALDFNQNLSEVTNGKLSFNAEHFSKAVEVFGVDANFFFSKVHTKMFKTDKLKPAIVELREATARVADEMNLKETSIKKFKAALKGE